MATRNPLYLDFDAGQVREFSPEDSFNVTGVQTTLVSGTNIKTINGDSVLGSGNLVVTGSGAAWGDITGTLTDQTDLTGELEGKQPLDGDLTAISALSPTNDDIIQRKSGAWTNRTMAQLKTDLALTGTDLLAAWPVGAIYMSVVSTSPATLFGGTWSAFGAGRVLVGIDAGQTEFDTVEETGGAKTHTLTEAEIPAHTHIQDSHVHAELAPSSASGGALTMQIDTNASGSQNVGLNTGAATAVNQNTGGGGAHNNLQPYIVVYMWKRTA